MKPNEAPSHVNPGFNTFKNNNIHRGAFTFPVQTNPAAAPARDVQTFTFQLTDQASFIEFYIFATDYNSYFRYLDSVYHNFWVRLEQVTSSFLIMDDPVTSLYFYDIDYKIVGNTVTVRRVLTNFAAFPSGNPVILTAGMTVPFAFVEYALAEQFS